MRVLGIAKVIGVVAVALIILIASQIGFGSIAGATSGFGVIASFALATVVGLGIVVLATSLFNRLVLKSALPELIGADNAFKPSPPWIFLGFGMIAALLGVYLVMGVGGFQPYYQETILSGVIISALVGVMSGFSEEIIFRYLMYGYLRRYMSKIFAALVSGAIFGVVHLNQVSSVVDGLTLILAATAVTVLFVAIYEASQTIWAPAFVHMSWNMFAVKVGFVMSNDFTASQDAGFAYYGFHVTSQSKFISGGSFGVEQSGIAITLYILVAISIWYFALRSQKA